MNTSADEAAAALRASRLINNGQQTLTEESRLLLAAMLRDEMRVAVAEGIQAVMTNEVFWARVFEVLQRQASERTGRFLVGGFIQVLKKLAWAGIVLLCMYSVGGWALVKVVWAAMNKAAT